MDSKFKSISNHWLKEFLSFNPVWSTQIGEHSFDDQIESFSEQSRLKQLAFNKTVLSQLQELDYRQLNETNSVDFCVLKNYVEQEIWFEEELQAWAWDPAVYNQTAGSSLYNLMARDFAPMSQRIDNALKRMQKLPTLFQEARVNLDPKRVPPIHAKTALEQHQGILSIINQLIKPNIVDSEQKEKFESIVKKTSLLIFFCK